MRWPGRSTVTTGAHLAGGLAAVGLAGYVYVAVLGRVFDGPDGAREVSALTSLYLLVNIIGPGIFAALEQETSRSVSRAVVAGTATRVPALRGALLAALASVALVAVALGAWPLVLSTVFGGRVGLLVALLLAIVGSAAVYWLRGVLGGHQRFRAYSLTFYVEGGARLVVLLVLPLAGVSDPVAYAMGFVAGSLVAAVAVSPVLRLSGSAGPAEGGQGMARSFLLLVGATALSQTIANIAPVLVTYRLPGDPVTSSVFGSTFVLARVPLFLFGPVLAVLLPMLTRAAAQGRLDDFSRILGRTVAAVLAVGAAAVCVSALAGPWVTQTLFATVEPPDRLTIALLTAATVGMMLALVLQPALVALDKQASVTLSWVSGAVLFFAVLVSALPPVAGALVAQLVGPLAVTALLAHQVRRTVRARRAADAGL